MSLGPPKTTRPSIRPSSPLLLLRHRPPVTWLPTGQAWHGEPRGAVHAEGGAVAARGISNPSRHAGPDARAPGVSHARGQVNGQRRLSAPRRALRECSNTSCEGTALSKPLELGALGIGSSSSSSSGSDGAGGNGSVFVSLAHRSRVCSTHPRAECTRSFSNPGLTDSQTRSGLASAVTVALAGVAVACTLCFSL